MSWVQLVQAISAELQSRMTAAGLANVNPLGTSPLVDGAILIGAQHLSETSTPPRVVFVPMGSQLSTVRSVATRYGMSPSNDTAEGAGVLYVSVTQGGTGASGTTTVSFSAPDLVGGTQATGTAIVTNGSVTRVQITNAGTGYLASPTVTFANVSNAAAFAALGKPAEYRNELKQRAIGNDIKQFTVWCWGCVYAGATPAPSPDGDWDATETLYQLLVQSIHALMPGTYSLGRGRWIDSTSSAARLISLGHLYSFELEIGTPLPDTALAFAPVDTYGSITLQNNTAAAGDQIAISG